MEGTKEIFASFSFSTSTTTFAKNKNTKQTTTQKTLPSTNQSMDPFKVVTEVAATTGSNHMKEMFNKWKEETLSTNSIRNWSIFCSKAKLSFPRLGEIPSRVQTNLKYFQMNYIIVFAVIALYSMLAFVSLFCF